MTLVLGGVLRRAAALLGLLAGCLAALVLTAPAASAADSTVTLGPGAPAAVTVTAGERVTFVNGEDRSHRVTGTSRDGSDPWTFDSGDLARGASASHVFPAAGTYAYTDRRAGSLLQLDPARDQPGTVRVTAAPVPAAPPAAPAAPAPPGPPPAAPAPAAPAPAPAAPVPAPVPPAGTGGSGAADLPGLVGGFSPPAPLGADTPVTPPSVAGLLGEQPSVAGSRREPVLAVEGPLPGSPTSRPLGLPAATAALMAAGLVSLLVRLLLAEPDARVERARGLVPVALD